MKNRQSAAKRLRDLISKDEGSTTISRKESTLCKYIMEKPNVKLYPIFPSVSNKSSAIYGIVFLGSLKIYIGRTKNLQTRMQKHRRNFQHGKENIHLYRAYNKYKNVYYFILDKDNSFEKELYWINYFNSYKKGYNRSENTSNNTLGKPSKNRKPVIALTVNGKFYRKFNSVTEAAKHFNTQSTNISNCCKKKLQTIKNYQFVYLNEYNVNKNYQIKTFRKSIKIGNKKFTSISKAAKYLNVHRHTLTKAIKNKRRINGFKLSYTKI